MLQHEKTIRVTIVCKTSLTSVSHSNNPRLFFGGYCLEIPNEPVPCSSLKDVMGKQGLLLLR